MFEIHRIPTEEDRITMVMSEGEKILCISSAKIINDTADIEFIDEFVPDCLFIMGKALLNSIDLSNIKKVTSKNKQLDKTLRILGFKENNNVYFLNLEGYFTQGCTK